MQVKYIPDPAKFPILSFLDRESRVRPIREFEEWTGRVAQKVFGLIDESSPSLWRIDNVVDNMPKEGDFMDMNIFDIPSVPGYDFLWLEYFDKAWGRNQAISIARNEHRDIHGRDVFLLHDWVDDSDGGVFLMPVEAKLVFAEDGTLEALPKYSVPDNWGPFPEDSRSVISQSLSNAVARALTAMMFTHCKNIEVRERYPKRQVRRAREKRGEAVFKYNEVVISPDRVVLEGNAEAAEESGRTSRRLHMARGHFRTTNLFGKHPGTYWIPAHVRGNADNGTVYKDYKVMAPK